MLMARSLICDVQVGLREEGAISVAIVVKFPSSLGPDPEEVPAFSMDNIRLEVHFTPPHTLFDCPAR